MYTRIKTPEEIENMRTSGKILAEVLKSVSQHLSAGMSTLDIDNFAQKEIKALGGDPAFLGYGSPNPFTGVICISINDEVVHGLPSPSRIINNGDIISLDLGVTYRGMITDAAITTYCGEISDELKKLLEQTKKSLSAGIAVVKDGVKVGDISAAVQKVLDKGKYGIVRDLVGHGVGHEVHEDPNIPNFGLAGKGPKLVAGMTIAIEPMATLGNYGVYLDSDGWTIKTNDGSFAAHFEHTILITKHGHEILTL